MVLLTKLTTPLTTKIGYNGTGLDSSQFDSWASQGGIGGFQFKREKREGRNPSSGSRTSRKYGIATTFITNNPPLTNKKKDPIY